MVNNFTTYNPIFFKVLNSKKSLSSDSCCIILSNVTSYIDILTNDTTGTTSTWSWTTILGQFDALFRKILLTINSFENINLIFKLMISVLKIPGIISIKVKSSYRISEYWLCSILVGTKCTLFIHFT